MIKNDCRDCSEGSKDKLKSTSEDGSNEVPIVLLPNTVIEPNTMMVKSLHTSIALRAMSAINTRMSLADVTKDCFSGVLRRLNFNAFPHAVSLIEN
jgi:hypothetical protein